MSSDFELIVNLKQREMHEWWWLMDGSDEVFSNVGGGGGCAFAAARSPTSRCGSAGCIQVKLVDNLVPRVQSAN